MQSNTTELKTVGGHTVVMKEYITGREAEQLTIDTNPEDVGTKDRQKSIEMSHKGIALVVISVDGVTENVVEKILDMPVADYMEVVEKVTEIATGKKNEVSTPKI